MAAALILLACGGQVTTGEEAYGGDAGGASPPRDGGGEVPEQPFGAPSCIGTLDCGGESCCARVSIPGGILRLGRGTETCDGCVDGCPEVELCGADELEEHEVGVSSYYLDRFEVTVGRFRGFVQAYDKREIVELLESGAGAHPLIEGSGWDSAWSSELPADRADLEQSIACSAEYTTWSRAFDEHQSYPINCVSWFEAYAFCAWEGGRLPTEAEWEYAAAGGTQNRLYPWGAEAPTSEHANFLDGANSPFVPVGSTPLGDSRWGAADLAGGMWEWCLDWLSATYHPETQTGCQDCANLTEVSYRVARGGGWGSHARDIRVANRGGHPTRHEVLGFRCAHASP